MLPAKDFCFGTIDYSKLRPDESRIKFSPVQQTDEDALSTTSIMDYPKASLPEDVLIDIFQRLPIKSICKFKCLSKVWFSNLSDMYNNLMRIKTIENKPWAVFSNNHKSTRFLSSCKDLELSCYDGFSFGFLSESYRYHKLYILASNNGLILCSVVHDCTDISSYIVCNPTTKQSVSIPPPPKNSDVKFSYGLVCDTNSRSPAIACTSAFKVLRIETKLRSKTGLEVEIYFSDLDKWRTYNVEYRKPRESSRGKVSNVITHDGVVYWIEEDKINRVVAYDLNKINNYECDRHQCNVFFVPFLERHVGRGFATTECIGVSEDFVCYAHMRRTGEGVQVFRTWVLPKDDDDDSDEDSMYVGEYKYDSRDRDCYNKKSVWKIRFEAWLPDECQQEVWLMGFSPVNRHVVILADGDQIFTFDLTNYTYDLTNEEENLRPLCHPSSKNSFNQLEEKSEFLHSLCVPLGEYYWRNNEHAYAVIVSPMLTAVSKAARS